MSRVRTIRYCEASYFCTQLHSMPNNLCTTPCDAECSFSLTYPTPRGTTCFGAINIFRCG